MCIAQQYLTLDPLSNRIQSEVEDHTSSAGALLPTTFSSTVPSTDLLYSSYEILPTPSESLEVPPPGYSYTCLSSSDSEGLLPIYVERLAVGLGEPDKLKLEGSCSVLFYEAFL